MPVIVVTGLRLRDPALLDELFTAAVAAIEQAMKSGCLVTAGSSTGDWLPEPVPRAGGVLGPGRFHLGPGRVHLARVELARELASLHRSACPALILA
jgi:hypothetical protein